MLKKIISGGQTGADRAALDFAIAHGIPHGGWCPLGRLAEDGILDAKYHLVETPFPDYAQRTEWNVRDSDGTIIFTVGKELLGGSLITAEFAALHGKPWLHVSKLRDGAQAAGKLRRFIESNAIRALNIAGPRRSNEPTVDKFVNRTLERWWAATRKR